MRWLWALIGVVVLVAFGAFSWPTLRRTIVASHVVEAPAPARAPTSPSAPIAQSPPPATAPAPGSPTSPPAPTQAAQSAPSAPQSAPSAPSPAPAAQATQAAPTQAAQTQPSPAPAAQATEAAPSAPSPAPAAKATEAATEAAQTAPTATPLAAAGATKGEIPNKTPGSGDKAANELASLKPGFSAADLVSALNRSKFNFPSASAEIPAEMADFLKRAADEMKRLPPGRVLEVAGYTDSSGNPARNVTLSQKRAEAVRRALIAAGANPNTLVAKGYGGADPIVSNDTPEGRLRNRRIEFHVVRTP